MWAMNRKRIILILIGGVVVILIALTLVATLYKTPTCFDTRQNQGETGVDCGGPCNALCTPEVTAPVARFVRQLSPQAGRTDVIAYIDNKNANAAMAGARFTITLYGSDNIVIAKKDGTVDLPPHTSVPVFIPGFYSGAQTVARAFVSFDTSSFAWKKFTGTMPTFPISDISISSEDAARITATVSNITATPFYRLPVIITVFDASDNAIAASQTLITTLPPMYSAPVTFTWNTPFSAAPARVEIIPLPPLSSAQQSS
jgi:hypothetical protein